MIVESKNTEAIGGKESVSFRVAFLMLNFEMLPSVDLDDEFCRVTDEISDIWADGRLSPEACAI